MNLDDPGANGTSSNQSENGEQGHVVAKAALEGDISAVALDDIFQLFDYAGLTGELEVSSGQNSGYFFFEKGLLIFGMLTTNQLKLGEILVAEKYITKDQLDECLQLHRNHGAPKRLGNIMVEHGYINQENLVETIGRQIKAAVFEALSWREGRFSFFNNRTPGKEDILLSERVDHLLLEGMVHLDDQP